MTLRKIDEYREADVSESSSALQTALRRAFSLVFTPLYLFCCMFALRYGAEVSFAFAVPFVILASLAIIISMMFLSVRFSELKEQSARFSLSTIFLISIPVCVCLATIRLFLPNAPVEGIDPRAPSIWFGLVIGTLIYAFFTFVVLLSFAETIVWIAARIVCSRSRKRD